MRKSVGAALLAVAGLAFGIGAGPAGDGEKVFLVYSADERSEIFPCG